MPVTAIRYHEDGRKTISQGTGFMIKHKGEFYIVTAAHVVFNSHQVVLEKEPDVPYTVHAQLKAMVLVNDMAVLTVRGFTANSDFLSIDNDELRPGDKVMALGYANRRGWTESRGIALEYDELGPITLLASTCQVYDGMSGGPLLKDDAVVGMTIYSRFGSRTMKRKGGYHARITDVLKLVERVHESVQKVRPHKETNPQIQQESGSKSMPAMQKTTR
jgi:S1-C subfamily serine protease